MRPLRRRPKALDETPSLFRPAAGGGNQVIEHDGADRGDGSAPPQTSIRPQGWVATTESGERRILDEVTEAPTQTLEVRQMAEAIARRLSVRPKIRDRLTARGSGSLVSVPYRYGSDDIDLDRTLEVLTEHPVPDDTDIIVRERMRGRRAVALMVDVSGSMRGEKAHIAAATVGALARDLVDDELTVVAFWKDAVLVKPLAHAESATRILDALLRIPAKGLTNINFALTVGLGELGRSQARHRRGILLSDAVHNAGPDPRLVAGRFPRLDVLLETDGEHDADLASDLGRIGHGEVLQVRHHRDVAPALNRVFARM
jgi:Mg-chelatase subunit ChlD